MFQHGVRAEASQMDEGRDIKGARTTYIKIITFILIPCFCLCIFGQELNAVANIYKAVNHSEKRAQPPKLSKSKF